VQVLFLIMCFSQWAGLVHVVDAVAPAVAD